MVKPTAQEMANALGIGINQVFPLQKRGMPVHQIKKARERFDKNGFDAIHHGKSGGASNSGPSLAKTINAALGSGRVMPPDYTASGIPGDDKA
jgi:hypothetical protein